MSDYINKSFFYKTVSNNINSFVKYYDNIIQIEPLRWDSGHIRQYLNNSNIIIATLDDFKNKPEISPKNNSNNRCAFLFNGNLNYTYNIQEHFIKLNEYANRHTRYVIVLYNYYLSWLYKLASFFKIRNGGPPSTFITQVDFNNLTKLSHMEVVSQDNIILIPFYWFGIGPIINNIMKFIPILNKLSFVSIIVARPIIKSHNPSLSIIIPTRNEKNNIKDALLRLPVMNCSVEIIFVEGHSHDGTWDEIKKISNMSEYISKYKIKYIQQKGKGKFDAVKAGFNIATNDILTILDGDLTMPPELLPQFYNAYCEGLSDFINGSRLVYTMENKAMRPLNYLGNKFFAKILGFILSTPLGDSLCGTKMFPRSDYKRIQKWNQDFGDFDPFGDFEMLFSASLLKMGIIDVPIRYRARTYGTTQISRFKDGMSLLKMTLIGFFKIKLNKF